MRNNIETIDLGKVEKLSNFTISNDKVNKQVLDDVYKKYSKKPENLKTRISLSNKIYKDIYSNAEKNYNKNRDKKDKIKLQPKERELYVDSVYDKLKRNIKKIKSNKFKRNNTSGTIVKSHNRKGTKGVRSHFRKTRKSDLI